MVTSTAQQDVLMNWLQKYGFSENPFALREAEDEETHISEYFVEGPYYDEVKDDPRTTFVFAARGFGKSAYRIMIQNSCLPMARDNEILAVPYVDFSLIHHWVQGNLQQVTLEHHVRVIIREVLTALIREFLEAPEHFLKLSSERHGTLKWLAQQYAPALLQPSYLSDRMREWNRESEADDLEQVTEPDVDVQQLTAIDASRAEFLTTLFSAPLNPSFKDMSPIGHLGLLVDLSRRGDMEAVYILVDGLDEFFETATKPQEIISVFLLPLITNLRLMKMPHLAFKFFLPVKVAAELQRNRAAVRFDRLRYYELEWSDDDLLAMLHERLRAYSGGQTESLGALADMSIAGDIDLNLVKRAYGSPRALLSLGDKLLAAHGANMGEEWDTSVLTEADWTHALEQFGRVYGVPRLSIKEERQEVLIGGRPIKRELTSLEYNLLSFLYEHAGRIKSKDDIYDNVYVKIYPNPKGVSDEAMDSLMFRLRKKIEPNPKKPLYLITRRGEGYLLRNAK